MWGLPSHTVTCMLVRSYRTFPPLPAEAGGISLLHFPWGRPRRPLAVILALWSSDFPQMRPFGMHPRLSGLLAKYQISIRSGRASGSFHPRASERDPHNSCVDSQSA